MSEKRKEGKDKGRKYKELEVGEKVMIRIRGLIATLEDSWEGPYTIVKKCSAVSYQVAKMVDVTKNSLTMQIIIVEDMRRIDYNEFELEELISCFNNVSCARRL